MKTKLITFLFKTLLIINFATAQEYTIEEILSGNVSSISPSCINNNGVVVGICYVPSYGYYGFIYEKGIFNFIDFSGSQTFHSRFAVNDLNNFTGTVIFPASVYKAGTVYKGFFNYEFLEVLPGLDPDYSFGRDINNLNHIVGEGTDGENYFIVVYDETEIIDTFNLGPVNGSDLRAINDSGFVTGNNWFPYETFPFIYNYYNSQFTYLPNINSEDQEAEDINNLNQVVGQYNHSDTLWAGFIWDGSSYTFLPDKSYPEAINDSGVVVGEFSTNDPWSHPFVYDPINGFRDLNALIPQGSGWELIGAEDINELGQITGAGLYNGVAKGFILTPNTIIVTKPKERELFIAGEKDTIKWIGGGDVDSIKITAILNTNTSNPSEFIIKESYPADLHKYIWTIPDTLLSYKTKIKIEDRTDPSTFGESKSFRLKGYVLTRLKSDSTYEKYGRTVHAWQFGNTDTNMWWRSWWVQFNYNTAIDPFTNYYYDEDFYSVADSSFPDWVAFVRAFGVDQCYVEVPILGRFYKEVAVDYWKANSSDWWMSHRN